VAMTGTAYTRWLANDSLPSCRYAVAVNSHSPCAGGCSAPSIAYVVHAGADAGGETGVETGGMTGTIVDTALRIKTNDM